MFLTLFCRILYKRAQNSLSLKLLPSTSRVILPAVAAATATCESMMHVALVNDILAVYKELGTALFVMIDSL